MSKQKRQFAKKKEREKKSKLKVLARRERIQQKAKEIKKWEKEEIESKPKKEPIRKNSAKYEAMQQYLHNLKILEALNEEHEKGNI